MRNSYKIKVGVLAVFTGAASLLAASPLTSSSSAMVLYDASSSPRTLYTQNCARCHGADGKANTRLGRKYKADDISGGVGVNKTVRIVTSGKGHMPSFKRRLTADQISQIANYVRSL